MRPVICKLVPVGIVVVECGTKDQIDRLYRVFNQLAVPCFVLFNYDKGGEAATAKEKEPVGFWL